MNLGANLVCFSFFLKLAEANLEKRLGLTYGNLRCLSPALLDTFLILGLSLCSSPKFIWLLCILGAFILLT